MNLTQGRLKELFDFDPDVGVFIHSASKRKSLRGKPAGYITHKGYVSITVAGVEVLAHRLAWLWVTGEFPRFPIDHVNREKQDNRFCNLRKATVGQNNANIGITKSNTTGFKGVYRSGDFGRYRAMISSGKSLSYLGCFGSPEAAARAYDKAALVLHGEFAVTNKSLGILS